MMDPTDAVVREFMEEYPGVSEPTARRLVDLTVTLSVTLPEQEAEAEFRAALEQAQAGGEAWAGEFLRAVLAKRLPEYRRTYDLAVTCGGDPVAALRHAHRLDRPAAAEVSRLLRHG